MAVGSGLADTYAPPLTVDPTNDADAVSKLFGIASAQTTPEFSAQAVQVDSSGNPLLDITAWLNRGDSDEVDYDSTSNIQESARFVLSSDISLQWGLSLVALYQLIRSSEYNASIGIDEDTFIRFALGQFVVTTPGWDDLDAADVRVITGYGKNYLLQNNLKDTLSFDEGSAYLDAITAVFVATGLVSSALSEVCDYPGSWPAKTLPKPYNYPLDEGTTYLSIVNELLSASGCRPISVQTNGRWQISTTPKPVNQALRWRWYASEDDSITDADLDAKVVLFRHSSYSGDVYNVPNRWVFIQAGLDFEPVEGSGQYTVNNTTIPPSDQVSVGRVLRSTQVLTASGQTDLQTQGDDIVTATLSAAEQITLNTTPWPVGRYYDIFQVTHKALPYSSLRRVQAQRWQLPLWGAPMIWQTNVVAQL